MAQTPFQAQGFFFELFGVTTSLWHDTPPSALSRFSDVSTISGQDQGGGEHKMGTALRGRSLQLDRTASQFFRALGLAV